MTDAFVSGLCERIQASADARRTLRIRGGGTKDFYGNAPRGDEVVEMRAHSGIVAYEPKELVLTVRAGTPLEEVERTLAAERQMLPFEPPHFVAASAAATASTGSVASSVANAQATIGGAVATGLSGPRRPYAGALRDFVLGTRIVNGRGEALAFGGRVIKNVAGYDVSRLMAGALGTLGVITEVSFKVLPKPACEVTLAFAVDPGAAIEKANHWAGKPLPLSAAAWEAGVLRVRLSGAPPAIEAARAKMGGEEDARGDQYWSALREQRLEFFAGAAPLWRLSVPQTTPPLLPGHAQLVDWGGGLRWLRGELDAAQVRDAAQKAGGHATLFRASEKTAGAFHPLAPAILKIHRRLKAAFDPAGILNPGRMYDF